MYVCVLGVWCICRGQGVWDMVLRLSGLTEVPLSWALGEALSKVTFELTNSNFKSFSKIYIVVCGI